MKERKMKRRGEEREERGRERVREWWKKVEE